MDEDVLPLAPSFEGPFEYSFSRGPRGAISSSFISATLVGGAELSPLPSEID